MNNHLSHLQQSLLPLLEWFHNLCVEHGWRYYALGGTMLGAARHEGFIPWDDDIDVGMPRKDYLQFLEYCKKQAADRFVVESIEDKNYDFVFGYAKLYDTTTTLVENNRYQTKRGIYMDIFPLDGALDSSESSKKVFAPIKKRLHLLFLVTCALRKGRKFHKNLLVVLGRLIPRFLLNPTRLIFKIDRMCQKHDFDECEYIGNFWGAWEEREIMPRAVLGKPTPYRFEGLTIFGAEHFDEYLTCLYGDWRKLPPKEKQVTHHDFSHIDLENSYLHD